MESSPLVLWFDLMGVFFFALSGNLLAARKDIDITGGLVLGLLAPYAELGMADVTGTLDVYSRHGKASPACTVNQGHGFAEAKKDNLTLTLRCHEDTAWPYHELLN